MTQIRLPQFGMGMTDGTIIRWTRAEGESIAAGEVLCEIEAAKTTVEYESPVSGTIAKILVPVDTNVAVNTPIAEITDGVVSDGAVAAVAEEADVPAAAIAAGAADGGVKATPLAKRVAEQEGVDLASVAGSGPGGRIRRDDVAGAAGATGTVQIEPRARKLAQDLGVDLASVRGNGPDGRVVAEDVFRAAGGDVSMQVEPRARKAARERGVDLAQVTGSGPGGRIVAEDVIAFAEAPQAAPAPAPSPAPAPAPAGSAVSGEAGYLEIKHSMMRKTIARRLTESKQTVPHFYLKANCRMDDLLALRKRINVDGHEKVSVNDFVIRAVAVALTEVPEANVTWDEKVLRRYDQVDISVAVATPKGLVTPVVRNVAGKNIRQIAAEVKELAGRGRDGKLRPEEYAGGTTSISNLGMFGVEEFSAIINPPQSTIFAVGAGEERIVAVNGQPVVATMMTVMMSVDHRAIDGAVGAQLLAAFKAIIENPGRILA